MDGLAAVLFYGFFMKLPVKEGHLKTYKVRFKKVELFREVYETGGFKQFISLSSSNILVRIYKKT